MLPAHSQPGNNKTALFVVSADGVNKGSLKVIRVERVKGIEPSYAAWEAAVLPLNYTRIGVRQSL